MVPRFKYKQDHINIHANICIRKVVLIDSGLKVVWFRKFISVLCSDNSSNKWTWRRLARFQVMSGLGYLYSASQVHSKKALRKKQGIHQRKRSKSGLLSKEKSLEYTGFLVSCLSHLCKSLFLLSALAFPLQTTHLLVPRLSSCSGT